MLIQNTYTDETRKVKQTFNCQLNQNKIKSRQKIKHLKHKKWSSSAEQDQFKSKD